MTTTRGRDIDAARTPPRPHHSPLKGLDPVWLLALNVGVITFMWVRHGGLDRIGGTGEGLVAVGQVTGLYAAIGLLLGLLLASRTPWLERRYGMDRMIHAHRLVGFTTVWLVVAHVVFVIVGFALAADISLWDQIVDTVVRHPYVAQAVAGFLLILWLGAASIRAVRRSIPYEAWWFMHITAYAAVALAFGHQTAIGADFVLDRWAWWYWSLLYLSVAYLISVYRWMAPLYRAWRHRFAVAEAIDDGPGVVTLVIGGRGLEQFPVQAGQFFLLRALTRKRWWKAHPFSISAAPDGSTLRFTVKALGDDSTDLQTIPVGTRFALEGPYGGFLAHLPTDRRLLFIAGGIGITPFRGLIDDLERPEDVALLYRNPHPGDTVFRDDLERLSEERGFDLRFSYSRFNGGEANPFDPDRLRDFVPDITEREVFVIGSPRLIDAARSGLKAAGVPASRIHLENFAY
jgi:predicted ferric reductase